MLPVFSALLPGLLPGSVFTPATRFSFRLPVLPVPLTPPPRLRPPLLFVVTVGLGCDLAVALFACELFVPRVLAEEKLVAAVSSDDLVVACDIGRVEFEDVGGGGLRVRVVFDFVDVVDFAGDAGR